MEATLDILQYLLDTLIEIHITCVMQNILLKNTINYLRKIISNF